MKLLSKTVAQSRVKQDNDQLIESNVRLRHIHGEIVQKLNTVKESYEPDKLQKLKEYEAFVKDITTRKSSLLRELTAIEKAIEEKKDLFYALITKQDALEERIYHADEREKKLNLREAFVVDLEQKWRAKQQ